MKIKHKIRTSKGFTLVELLVVIAIIAGLAAMAFGPIMRQIKAGEKTKAIGKANNILVAMLSFASDNSGQFPNDSTSRQPGGGGGTSNDYLQQLIDSGKVDNEKDFWVKENSAVGTVKTSEPNNNSTLEAGENAWGYVVNLANTSNTNLPLIFDSSSSAGEFNTAVWEGYAIVGKIDKSVAALPISYGSGKPLNDDNTGKTGPVEEPRGDSKIDLFAAENFPDDAEVTVPTSGSN